MGDLKQSEYDVTGRHEFLIDSDGELMYSAKQLPIVREYVESLPETAATFRLNNVPEVTQKYFNDIILEFLGLWRLPNQELVENPYIVNPNYIHANRFSDLLVRCDCGAHVHYNYENGDSPVENAGMHREDCMPFYRVRARADISELRYNEIQRLSWLGWKGIDMAPRFGMDRSSLGHIARDFGFTLQDLYHRYQASAGKTYSYFVHEKGVSADTVADVYGHSKNTLYRWSKRFEDQQIHINNAKTVVATP